MALATLNGPQLFSKPTFECRIEGQGKHGARRESGLFAQYTASLEMVFYAPALGRRVSEVAPGVMQKETVRPQKSPTNSCNVLKCWMYDSRSGHQKQPQCDPDSSETRFESSLGCGEGT